MMPSIYFWSYIMDITGRTAIILIIAFVISHLIIKNNFNIIRPNIIEQILLTLTYILIYTFTLLFNYGEERLLIFDLALPIVIVAGILSGLRVSLVVSIVAAITINSLFTLSWPYAILTILAGIVSGLLSHLKLNNTRKMLYAGILQFFFSGAQVMLVYFFFEGFLYQVLWQNILAVILIILVQIGSVLIFLYIIYSIIDYQKQQRMLYLQNQKRLRTLESQVNPHFLFNSLNTIGSLTRRDPEKAHSLIIELSALLRSSLRKQGELVSLVDEIRNIDSYTEIAKARFGQRFQLTKDIPDIYNKYQVPNLIWEPIVENAIIHNIKQQDTVSVKLSVKRTASHLLLITQDDGQGIPPAILKKIDSKTKHHKHLGLPSTVARLKNFYQEEKLVDIDSSPKGTIVILKIPLK
jgi:LytS/YehU family sensor histidine kinase